MATSISINVRRIRKMRELTQQQIADMAGISRNAYRSIEAGTSLPRGNNLSAIARALRVSVFDLSEEIPPLRSIRFRALRALSGRQKAEREYIFAEVAIWLRNFSELELMLGERRPYVFAKGISSSDPRSAAVEARARLGMSSDHCIADICGMLDEAGIKICLLSSTLDAFFGLSVGPSDGGPAVAVNVNESIPIERRIFTAAHELGHLLMHVASYDSDQAMENKEQESQANQFASFFLMPDEGFRRMWSQYRGLNFVHRVLWVKRIFRVSYKTVLVRLVEAGAADNGIFERFSRSYASLYGKKLAFKEEPDAFVPPKYEPINLQSEDFVAGRFWRLVRDALDGNLITLSRAAEISGISVSNMRGRVEDWGMTGDGT